MIVRPRPLACRMRASISTLSMACARYTNCSTALTVWAFSFVVAHRPDVRRLGHVAAREGHDGARHRRGEEHRLARRRGQRQELLDVGQEAEVEHLVGLVEHDGACLRQVEVALLGEVDQTTGRADDDLDAGLEGLDLGLVGATAVDGEHPDAALAAGALEVARDLHGELTRRRRRRGPAACRERRANRRRPRRAATTRLQHRHAEAEGLAGAGLGLADDVVAGQRHRQRHRLDGEGRDDPVLGERGDDVGVDVEVREGEFGGDRRGSRLGDRLGDPLAAVGSGASVATPASAGISWGWVMGISRSARAPRLCGSSVARDGPIGDCQGRWVALARREHCAGSTGARAARTTWANHRADRAPSCPAQSTGMRAERPNSITRLAP